MMSTDEEPTDLDWVQLRKEMGAHQHVETTTEKFGRKFSENPFVPIGMLLSHVHNTYVLLSPSIWLIMS